MEDITINTKGPEVITNNTDIPKIGIGLSIGKDVSPLFLKMIFARFGEWIQKYIITIIIDSTIPLDLSRNNVVNSAIEQNCDYLFFIDSDILIEEGQLERLLSHNKDIISGIYHEKVPPHIPLPKKRVAENLYFHLELEGNNIIEIDGAGMGCLLVKMNVFDKLSYPWFEFKYYMKDGEWNQLSEDLHFCQKLQNIGIKIYCDPMVMCTHIGTSVTINLAQRYKDIRINTLNEIEKTVRELSEFAEISTKEVYDKWMVATKLAADEYKGLDNNSNFYKKNKNYVFHLTNLHMGQKREFDNKLVESIKEIYPPNSNIKILDFGCGCGQNAIDLASSGYNVTVADYEGYTSQFVRFRVKKRGLNIKFYDIEKQINDKFDIILLIDVLEYIPDDKFRKTIDLIKNLRLNGRNNRDIFITTDFSHNKLYPMRYNPSIGKFELIKSLESI